MSREYEDARESLLDALDALDAHRDALVLVGAQAVYQYTSDTDLDVAEYTTDADLSINPTLLSERPLIDTVMANAHFTATKEPGHWLSPTGVAIDLMVPAAMAGAGRRGARLGAHGSHVARRARGLEASLVDRQRRRITSLRNPGDRARTVWVAGPAALLVAKVIKVAERIASPSRLRDKDALDIFRLLQAVATEQLAESILMLLDSELAGEVTNDALGIFQQLFTTPRSHGTVMAGRASGLPLDDITVIRESMALLATELTERLAT